MYNVFKSCGFTDVTGQIKLSNGNGLVKGDVLLNTKSHTAIYIGDGQIVHASINELGKVSGGKKETKRAKRYVLEVTITNRGIMSLDTQNKAKRGCYNDL